MNSKKSKLSSYAVSLLLGAIIIAFVLTGFQGFTSNSGEVANVNGTPITAKEYNQAVAQSTERFTQMLGGKSLTQKQIRDFRIRETALNQLISQKHFLNFASKLQLSAGHEAVKSEIKDLPYFQTAGKFDVSKYKMLLSANRLSPSEFEAQIIDQVKTNKLSRLVAAMKDSKAKEMQMAKLMNSKALVTYALVNKNEMRQNIEIAQSEVSEFTANKANESLINSLYETYKSQTTQEKGKVKPLAQMKSQLAKEHLQRTKVKELTELNLKIKEELDGAFKAGDMRKVSSLKKKYNFEYATFHDLSKMNLSIKGLELDQAAVLTAFNAQDTKSVFVKDTDNQLLFAKATSYVIADQIADKDLTQQQDRSMKMLMNEINSQIIESETESGKVTIASNLFQ